MNNITEQLTEALDQALRLLKPNKKEHIPVLVEGWATLAKAEGQPVAFFYEQRGLEAMPSLLDSIDVNEWEWGCSFDLPHRLRHPSNCETKHA
jgi:hypothetical protein